MYGFLLLNRTKTKKFCNNFWELVRFLGCPNFSVQNEKNPYKMFCLSGNPYNLANGHPANTEISSHGVICD